MGLIHTNSKTLTKVLTKVQGSSVGIQPKCYDNGYWYKKNIYGCENQSEHLASLVLMHSNITNYVFYTTCTIDDVPGCVSKNFLLDNESFLSFHRLHELIQGETSLDNIMQTYDTCAERINFIEEFLYDTLEYDCSEYLSQVLSLDALLLNPDRHFNNLGVIINNQTGCCRTAPIFDNGAALLSSYRDYPSDIPFEEHIQHVLAQPFSGNFIEQAEEAGIGLQLDYNGLYTKLLFEPPSRALDVLYYQLEQMKYIIPVLEAPKIPFINYDSPIQDI